MAHTQRQQQQGIGMALAMACAAALLQAPGAAAAARQFEQGTDITMSGGGSNPLFPPFSRCDRDMSHTPYRVTQVPDADPSLVCFGVTVAPCDARWKCCNMDMNKFELAVNPGVKANVKAVYVDGVRHPHEFNTKVRVLRVANLYRSPANATGARVCVKTEGLSDAVQGLCRPAAWATCMTAVFNSGRRDCCPITLYSPPPAPSPPPPPPPPAPRPRPHTVLASAAALQSAAVGGFPYGGCERGAGPLTLSAATTSTQTDGTVQHCFSVVATGAWAGACGAMDLHKIEFGVKGACAGALSYVTVNGVKRPPFFQAKPFAAIKINNLNKTISSAPGTVVCMALKPPCATLPQLCEGGSCQYALFNSPAGHDYRCCPVGTMSFPPSK